MRRLLVLACLVVSASAHAAITGHIVDENGKPLSGARVRLFVREAPEDLLARLLSQAPEPKAFVEATAGEDGSFSLATKGNATVDLVADASGRQPYEGEVVDGDEVTILLPPATMQRGKVTAGGKAVSGALVMLGRTTVVRTAADGTYELPASQRAMPLVVHPDYAMPDPAIRANPSLKDVQLVPGVAIRGRVVGPDGTTPAANVRIYVDNRPLGESDADGSFAIPHAPRNWRTLEARRGSLVAAATRTTEPALLRLREGATISGNVRNASGGAPVAGAVVMILSPRARSSRYAIANAKGEYTLTGLLPGPYLISASHPAFNSQPSNIDIADRARVTRSIAVTPLLAMKGIVTDEAHKPVVAAVVSTQFGGRRTVTGSDGRFALRYQPPPPAVYVTAIHNGFAPVTNGPLGSGALTNVSLVLPRGFPVTIKLVDKGGSPIAGEMVSVRLHTDATSMPPPNLPCPDSTDTCHVSGWNGTVETRLTDGTYDITAGGFASPEKTVSSIALNARSSPVTITLDHGVDVSGRIVYSDGSPATIPNLRVQAKGVRQAATADANGAFTLRNVTPGKLEVAVMSGGDAWSSAVTITAPASDVVLTIPKPSRIEGTVTDRGTQQPVHEFTVARRFGDSAHFTSDEGKFVLEDVQPGAATAISVSADGYATATLMKIDLDPGKTTTVNVPLERGGTIRGVVKSSGTAVANVAVTIEVPRPTALPQPQPRTDANGEFEMTGLAAGEYSLSFRHPDFAAARKPVQVAAGKESAIEVDLERGLELRGRVGDSAGQPVAAARIYARVSGTIGPPPSAQSDADGTFVLRGLTEGRTTISAAKNGYVTATQEVDPASAPSLNFVLDRGATVSGRVTGVSESEMPLVSVSAYGQGTNASAHPDASGRFTLQGLKEGRVTLRAVMQAQMNRASAPKTIDIANGTAPDVELDFGSGFTLHGTVRRAGEPLIGARVTFASGTGPGSTAMAVASDGTYQVSVPAAGDYVITVYVGNENIDAGRVNVKSDMSYDIDLSGSDLRVRVVDASTGEPLSGAHVVLTPLRGRGRGGLTDASGRYVFSAVPDGAYNVMTVKDGYGNDTRSLSVRGTPDEVTISLRGGQRTVVRVVDAMDRHPLDAQINITDDTKRAVPTPQLVRDETGAVSLWLSPGHYRMRIWAPGYTMVMRDVNVPQGPLEVALQRGGRVIVPPVDGAKRVRLLQPDGRPFLTASVPPGVFETVPPGTYRVEVLDSAQQVIRQGIVTVISGETMTASLY